MESYLVTVVPSKSSTRVLLTRGRDELMRAVLPPPSEVRHEPSMIRLLEGLSLCLDARLTVALCVAKSEAGFCLGLTDEFGVGARSLYYAVEVMPHRRRGRRLHGVAGFGDVRQLRLWGSCAQRGEE